MVYVFLSQGYNRDKRIPKPNNPYIVIQETLPTVCANQRYLSHFEVFVDLVRLTGKLDDVAVATAQTELVKQLQADGFEIKPVAPRILTFKSHNEIEIDVVR